MPKRHQVVNLIEPYEVSREISEALETLNYDQVSSRDFSWKVYVKRQTPNEFVALHGEDKNEDYIIKGRANSMATAQNDLESISNMIFNEGGLSKYARGRFSSLNLLTPVGAMATYVAAIFKNSDYIDKLIENNPEIGPWIAVGTLVVGGLSAGIHVLIQNIMNRN